MVSLEIDHKAVEFVVLIDMIALNLKGCFYAKTTYIIIR